MYQSTPLAVTLVSSYSNMLRPHMCTWHQSIESNSKLRRTKTCWKVQCNPCLSRSSRSSFMVRYTCTMFKTRVGRLPGFAGVAACRVRAQSPKLYFNFIFTWKFSRDCVSHTFLCLVSWSDTRAQRVAHVLDACLLTACRARAQSTKLYFNYIFIWKF